MAFELRSVEALVAASKSAAPPDRHRLLATARAQAVSPKTWETILEEAWGLVDEADYDRLVAAAIESARTRGDIWTFTNAAAAQAEHLGRPDLARQALHAAEQMLAAARDGGNAEGFLWGVLAQGFKALGDDVEVARALEIGWELTWSRHDVENLGRLANFWAKLLDREAAIARLARVEEAAAGWGNLGGLVYWWSSVFGDAAAGRRVRQAALQTVTRFDQALNLARCWKLQDNDSAGIEQAFAKAEELATTAANWFDLARHARFAAQGHPIQSRALDRAAALADGAELKARISFAYIDWFGDRAAAARVGPPGLRPDDLRNVHNRIEGWEGSASGLFDWLRERVTPRQLSAIAEADYGHDAPEHLTALLQIVTSGVVPVDLPWHPAEVVALTRWADGPGVDHVQRALCCVLLCLADRDDQFANTAAPLVESLLALEAEAAALGERLMAWRWETATDDDGDERFVALLALCMLRAAADPNDPRLDAPLRRLSAPDARGLRECLASSVARHFWERLIESTLSSHLSALGWTVAAPTTPAD
jgi:hypothetical protein